MNIKEYKVSLKNPLLPRTCVFLFKENKILLGLKKRGFGKDYFVGIGGKVESNETIERAAMRELHEEIGITFPQLTEVGTIDFYFPHISDESWNQRVYVFICRVWKNEPKETDEIKPFWFAKKDILYEKMWNDASYWLEKVCNGEIINAAFLFDQNLKVVDYTLTTREYLDNRQIVFAKPEDAPFVVRIFKNARAHMNYLPNLHTDEETTNYITTLVTQGKVLIAKKGNTIVGFGQFSDGWLNHLYIDPHYQHEGFGKLLLTKIKLLSQKGIYLWVFEDNKNAIRFYEREGFLLKEKRTKENATNEENMPDRKYYWEKR